MSVIEAKNTNVKISPNLNGYRCAALLSSYYQNLKL